MARETIASIKKDAQLQIDTLTAKINQLKEELKRSNISGDKAFKNLESIKVAHDNLAIELEDLKSRKTKEIKLPIDSDFLATFKDFVKVDNYPTETVGLLKLKRSRIPKNQCESFKIHIDRIHNLDLAANATRLGLTSDEFVRNLIWLFNDMYRL